MLQQNNNGQAALIIILVTAVVVTIVMGTVKRTIIDVRTSSQTEEAYEALNAGDSALEMAKLELLGTSSSFPPSIPSSSCTQSSPCEIDGIPQAQYWYEMEQFPQTDATEYSLGGVEGINEHKTVWFVEDYAQDRFPDATKYYNVDEDVAISVTVTQNTDVWLYVTHDMTSCDGSTSETIVETFNSDPTDSLLLPGTYTKTFNPDDYMNCLSSVTVKTANNQVIDDISVSNYNTGGAGFAHRIPQGVKIKVYGEFLGSGIGAQKATSYKEYVYLVKRWDYMPIAYYDLDEGSGLVVNDYFRRLRAEAEMAPPEYWETINCNEDSCIYNLLGSTRKITINNMWDLQTRREIANMFDNGGTISAWINTGDCSSNICNIATVINNGGWFIYVTGNTLNFWRTFGPSGGTIGHWRESSSGVDLTSGIHHVVVVYDDSSSTNEPTFYIDSGEYSPEVVSSPSGSATSFYPPNIPPEVYISNNDAGTRPFIGRIDDVMFIDQALEIEQIEQLYNLGY